jgi:hypothetical protein
LNPLPSSFKLMYSSLYETFIHQKLVEQTNKKYIIIKKMN